MLDAIVFFLYRKREQGIIIVCLFVFLEFPTLYGNLE